MQRDPGLPTCLCVQKILLKFTTSCGETCGAYSATPMIFVSGLRTDRLPGGMHNGRHYLISGLVSKQGPRMRRYGKNYALRHLRSFGARLISVESFLRAILRNSALTVSQLFAHTSGILRLLACL
ncbi:hypothetical protein AT959_11185 [Dechloromonas denitrificans]|uniref:Uncharacterized protein n=1 Tax=Dechloromonas denitrificans TaxID=281362 RepID=A0A133XGB7_9RHOO|nr:hypothetical protein AT959_11185 [Dechloromonas denitrificans]